VCCSIRDVQVISPHLRRSRRTKCSRYSFWSWSWWGGKQILQQIVSSTLSVCLLSQKDVLLLSVCAWTSASKPERDLTLQKELFLFLTNTKISNSSKPSEKHKDKQLISKCRFPVPLVIFFLLHLHPLYNGPYLIQRCPSDKVSSYFPSPPFPEGSLLRRLPWKTVFKQKVMEIFQFKPESRHEQGSPREVQSLRLQQDIDEEFMCVACQQLAVTATSLYRTVC